MLIPNKEVYIFAPGAMAIVVILIVLFSGHLSRQNRLLKAEATDNAIFSPAPESNVVLSGHASLDTTKYNALLRRLAHDRPMEGWPVHTPYPLPGAIFPFKRVVAYYGNFYSQGMGILGELPEPEVLQRLTLEAARWQQADPVIRAARHPLYCSNGAGPAG